MPAEWVARYWEVAGTREVPEWEREALERLEHQLIPLSADRPEPTFPKERHDPAG